MGSDRSLTQSGAAGPAPGAKFALNVSRHARSVIALGTILAAALALEPGALASALAREAGKAGSSVSAALNKHEDAREGSGTQHPVPALTLIQMHGQFAVADLVGDAGGLLQLNIKVPPHKPTDYMLLSFRGLPKNFPFPPVSGPPRRGSSPPMRRKICGSSRQRTMSAASDWKCSCCAARTPTRSSRL